MCLSVGGDVRTGQPGPPVQASSVVTVGTVPSPSVPSGGHHVVAVIELSRIMVKAVERIVRCGSEGLFPHWRFAGATVLG